MAGEIEFLVEEPDEEPDGEGSFESPPPSRPTWLVWAARSAVVVVIAAAGIAWAATRPGAPPETPVAAPPASTPITRAPITRASITRAVPTPVPDSAIVMCREGAPDKPAVVAAMRRFLPKIVIDTEHAYLCYQGYGTTRLAGETITGSYRGLGIKVDLSPAGHGSVDFAPAPVGRASNVLLGRFEAESAAVRVAVSAYGRTGVAAPIDRLGALGDYIVLNLVL